MPADAVVLVLTTWPAATDHAAFASALVEERLAACVNVIAGVRSIYRWQGRVCDDREDLLVIKTGADRLEALTARLKEIHPYEVPEVLALPVEAGAQAYLDWLTAETRPA